MHDIWNPWHGCKKVSEGCDHCYMYYLDRQRGRNGAEIYRVKNSFYYPLQKNRDGGYKIKAGEQLRVCMTSDFFLEEADAWRDEAWEIMSCRPDVVFFLLTKRPERVAACLPHNWGDGWENIFYNVTCENQRRADERIPILLDLPFKHKGIMCAPFIGPVSVAPYLAAEQIEQVICGGENYDGARPCNFAWVQQLYRECAAADVTFCFIETGTKFIKDGRMFTIPDKVIQSRMARKSGMQYSGRPMRFHLTDPHPGLFGTSLSDDARFHPYFAPHCEMCGSQPICNGCAKCAACTAIR